MGICRTEHRVSAHMTRVLASLGLVSFTELHSKGLHSAFQKH